MNYLFVAILFLFTIGEAFTQIGGESSYNFLNIPVTARSGALGGSVIAIKDHDPSFTIDNPSLLSKEMNTDLTLTYLNYFADVNLGYFSYVHDFKKYGTFSGGLKYINYGKFNETDEGGNELGSFSAAEYAFILGWGKQIDTSFSVGANLKPIYSKYYENTAFALAFDVSATYHNAKKNLTAALVIKNIGRQLNTFVDERDAESMPFQIQAGVSKKLAHTPIRLNVDFIHLNNWSLAYNDSTQTTNEDPTLTDEEKAEKNKTGIFTEMFRHIVVGTEFMLSPNFMIRVGYHVKRRSELAFVNKGGMVGFSWGLGFRINKFHISYGGASYHLAGLSNHFTVSTTLGDYYKKDAPQIPKEKKQKERKKAPKTAN